MSSLSRRINWERLTSIFSSRFSTYHASSKGKSSGSAHSHNSGRKARYADLDDSGHKQGLSGYETAPIKLMRTYVRTGKTDQMEDDGIHLQYDIEQETSPKTSGILRA